MCQPNLEKIYLCLVWYIDKTAPKRHQVCLVHACSLRAGLIDRLQVSLRAGLIDVSCWAQLTTSKGPSQRHVQHHFAVTVAPLQHCVSGRYSFQCEEMPNSHNWGGSRRGAGRKKKGPVIPPTRITTEQTGSRRRWVPSSGSSLSEPEQENEFQGYLVGLARLAEEAEEQIHAGSGDGEEDPDDDSSEDEDDDSGNEYEPDQDSDSACDDDYATESADAVKKKRNSAQYKPPHSSFLAQVLAAKSQEIGRDPKAKNGRHWYFPEEDPVSATIKKVPEPEDWYRGNIRCYNWCPFSQYCGIVGNLQADYKCIHADCKMKGLVSNGYYWRYVFDFNGIFGCATDAYNVQRRKEAVVAPLLK